MNVLVVTYWSYKDALIQSYTLPYVKIITSQQAVDKLYLLTIEHPFHKMSDEEWGNETERLKSDGIHLIRFNYDYFGLKMMLRFLRIIPKLYRLIKKENIQSIHCWCMTAGGLGYILAKLTKRPLVIDSYEPHAESMVENGTWTRASLKFKLLSWLERKQSQHAQTVIALTQEMRKYAKEKYNTTFKHYFVKPALVDLDAFQWSPSNYKKQRKEHQLTNEVVGIYAGKLGGIYLNEEVFDFIKVASEHWGVNFKFFLLTDTDKKEVDKLLTIKGIPSDCVHVKFVPYKEIKQYYALADFAINPVKPVPSKRYCTSIKDGEYWAMGLPVIITKNIADDFEIIQHENIGYVLKDLSTATFKRACEQMDELMNQGNDLREKIRTIAEQKRSFNIAKEIYWKIYS